MADQESIAYRVRGRVQGVGFRWSARSRARELGLGGSVHNEAAGTVLVVIRGDEAGLEAMRTWLERGPPAARVTAVQRVPVPPGLEPEEGTTFRILR